MAIRLTAIGKEIFSDITRGFRLLVIIAPISILTVLGIYFANPTASGDEIATTGAVPLLISYLMVRAIMWLASGTRELTEEEKRALKERQGHDPEVEIQVHGALALVFVLGMWWIVAGGLSFGIYVALGLVRAASATVLSLKWTAGIVALVAILIVLMQVCRSWLLKIAKFFRDAFEDPLSFLHGRA